MAKMTLEVETETKDTILKYASFKETDPGLALDMIVSSWVGRRAAVAKDQKENAERRKRKHAREEKAKADAKAAKKAEKKAPTEAAK